MERTEENLPTGMAGGIRHRLMVTHFLTSLIQARSSSAEIGWLSEDDWLAHAGNIRVPVRAPRGGPLASQGIHPDAYFTIGYPDQGRKATRHFFLEADRGTEPGRRKDLRSGTSLFKKFLAYEAWMRQRGHEKLGMPGFTVLTVTTSFDRAWNLRELAREVGGRGGSHAYWFAAEEQYRHRPHCFPSAEFGPNRGLK